MQNYRAVIQLSILTLLMIIPTISFAFTDEELIESVKNNPKVRQKLLEVTLPIERREKLEDPEKTINDEIYPITEVFKVPLSSQCGVKGCNGTVLVVLRYSTHTTNPGSRYVAALVKIENTKIRDISLAKISSDNGQ